MANTYYNSTLTAEEIDSALKAIDGVITPANNGKVLAIENGKIVTKPVTDYVDLNLQAKIAIPSASQQTISPDSGYNGLSSVTINGDADLVAGNIKKNVEIFGVTGSYEGGGITPTGTINITENGTVDVTNYANANVNVSGGGGAIVTPAYQDVCYCYCSRNGDAVYHYTATGFYCQLYEVFAHHVYLLSVGEKVGVRRRAGFFPNKTLQDFEPYLETPASQEEVVFSGGTTLAPFAPGTEDTGYALRGRIICKTGKENGVIFFTTDNTSKECPAYCIDLGEDLKSDYTFVEYIGVQSETGPFIDTNVFQTADTYFEIDADLLTNGGGFFYGNLSSPYTEIELSGSSLSIYINGSYTSISNANGRHTIKAYENNLSYDGNVIKSNLSWSATNSRILLFARGNGAGPDAMSYANKINLYNVKMWKGNTLIRDFKPCYRTKDNEPGMFDIVNDVFYPNLGAGSFVLGPVVN